MGINVWDLTLVYFFGSIFYQKKGEYAEMVHKDNGIFIKIPNSFIKGHLIPKEQRPGILMAYCWCSRFGTTDGLYTFSETDISNEMGLHYDKNKDRHLPKRILEFRDGLVYLIENKYISLLSGDVFDSESKIKVRVNYEIEMEKFLLLNLKHFDFVIGIQARTNKNDLLYTLCWVLSWYLMCDFNGSMNPYSVCSYGLNKMSEQLGIGKVTLSRYLKMISGTSDENYPLVKDEAISYKYQDNYISTPNIYVENTPFAEKILARQRNYYREKVLNINAHVPTLTNCELDDDLI